MNKKPQEVKVVRLQVQRKIPLVRKACPVCGKQFLGAVLAVYDSRQCKMKASYQRHAEDRRKARMKKYHAERKTVGKK
jgi:hypothetical protein